jgi:hypothetical protein
MSINEIFSAIKELVKVDLIGQCKSATLSIKEEDKQATLKLVQVVDVGTTAFLIKYDKGKFPGTSMFANHRSLHRGCDAIAFCEVDGTPYIMCFELKSSEPTRSGVIEQFRSAHCFLEYLDAVVRHYYRCGSISQWERRYFVFHNQSDTPLNKKPLTDNFDNALPERPRFIPVHTGQRIYVHQLLGKAL